MIRAAALDAIKTFAVVLGAMLAVSLLFAVFRGEPLGVPRLWSEWWFWLALSVGFIARVTFGRVRS